MSGSVSLINGHIDRDTSGMTDKEIIKALECCGNVVTSTCKGCPYHITHNANCVKALMHDALDLINRQQAEIEELKKVVIDDYASEYDSKIRAEAIKEFAERLKTEFSQYQREYRNVLNDEGACAMIIAKKGVDNLVKEMVGEQR